MADAASHELGHQLGLSHDGKSSSTYYGGHGDWGPIMGTGYGRLLSQWSKGEYSGATQSQDDLAIIAGHLPLRADDHGGDLASATDVASTAAASANPVVATGIITSATDVDCFKFVPDGGVNITVAPFSPGPNLDVALTVTEDLLGEIETLAPEGAGDVVRKYAANELRAGRAHVACVRGSANGDATTGWTTYGSIGHYTLTLKGVFGTPSPTPTFGVVSGGKVSVTTDTSVGTESVEIPIEVGSETTLSVTGALQLTTGCLTTASATVAVAPAGSISGPCFNLDSSSTLRVSLAASGEGAPLVWSGSVVLDGSLRLILPTGFSLSGNATQTVVTFASRGAGSFSSIEISFPDAVRAVTSDYAVSCGASSCVVGHASQTNPAPGSATPSSSASPSAGGIVGRVVSALVAVGVVAVMFSCSSGVACGPWRARRAPQLPRHTRTRQWLMTLASRAFHPRRLRRHRTKSYSFIVQAALRDAPQTSQRPSIAV
ncbi:peptidase domain-containing protein [Thecamonas trahens ATCC 50062]|uniref:Peptidase domain-containing protein n=1 Tax=Thecamonas trahens ATCC 50062 TaxID=461836 RepID=A0A0L0DAB7_THETB|nr:peptidase domain-containing protein [Thecamonas trahens ATCC 50062]KNC49175.1 peptidase domain-containing protein [Thecamonas trahens ATCC 50062]|eukprot:XP_013758195.1 peptidase domain-containing protein [Thecamonas trahens ATCC 50062]